MAKKYWMVHGPGHMRRDAPTMQHETPESALAEAERLCRSTGKEFYVLEAMRVVRRSESTEVEEIERRPPRIVATGWGATIVNPEGSYLLRS